MEDALAWADEHLQGRAWAAYTATYQAWASMLPAFAMGGTPPEPPEPPED